MHVSDDGLKCEWCDEREATMYGSDNAWECELCGVRDATVKKRTVACGDSCMCEDDRIACEKCAQESYK